MPISVAEYLATSYDPDAEYVDGAIVERNIGEFRHSLAQRNVIVAVRRQDPGLYVMPVLR
jgi:hypothetical protein